jgi:thymidylate synthase (FAD)
MVELKFHVKLPIFVARQLIRHRTANVNEYSLRYSLAPLLFYMPEFEVVRKQSAANRQGRGEQADREVYERLRSQWSELRLASSYTYQEALVDDIARELARIDLPLSIYTEWYWKIDLHNLFHFLSLRSDSHAQWEIQEYSNIKAGIVKLLCPLSFQAWIDYEFAAVTFSLQERQVLAELLTGLPRGGGTIERRCAELDMGVREIAEFMGKIEGKPKAPPSFDLDLTQAKTAEYFFARAQEQVPDIEAMKAKRAAT